MNAIKAETNVDKLVMAIYQLIDGRYMSVTDYTWKPTGETKHTETIVDNFNELLIGNRNYK